MHFLHKRMPFNNRIRPPVLIDGVKVTKRIGGQQQQMWHFPVDSFDKVNPVPG